MAANTFSNAPTSGQKPRQYQSSLSHSKVAQYWKRPTTQATASHDDSVTASSELKSEAAGKEKFNNPYVYQRTNTSKELHSTGVARPVLKDNFVASESSSKLRLKARDNSESQALHQRDFRR